MIKKKVIRGKILGLLMLSTATPVVADPVQYNGNWYEFVSSYGIAWDQARTEAENRFFQGIQGRLATVNSQGEDDFLFTNIGPQIQLAWEVHTDGAKQAWLGGYSPTRSTDPIVGWQWITGETWDYSGWRTNEPNAGFDQNVAAATEFQIPPNNCTAQCWNDAPVNWHGIEGYIVEYERISINVSVDIKPGSDLNSINICSNGAVPIAILGSDTLNVYDVNTETLRFSEAAVKVVGKKDPKSLCSYSDVNGDYKDDLICHYVTSDIAGVDGESSTADLIGELHGGTQFSGTDSVNIVKSTCN